MTLADVRAILNRFCLREPVLISEVCEADAAINAAIAKDSRQTELLRELGWVAEDELTTAETHVR